jgi:Cu-Zn family superoxide dismutase
MLRRILLVGLFTTASTLGCSRDTGDSRGVDSTSAAPPAGGGRRAASATAVVRDAAGRELGRVTLLELGDITLSGRLAGLAPGEHGVHLHSTGRCDPPAFESAGGHWNPTERQHGSANPQGPHAGDLPNFMVGSDSTGIVEGTAGDGSLFGDDPLLDADGAALIVHAGRDDYSSQPSGGAGPPVACGVIEPAAPDPGDSLR